VVKGLCKPDSLITVGELNEYLDQLANLEDNKERVKIMIKIIQQSSGEDIRWICKIILKDIKIGLKYDKLLFCYHPEAVDLYNLTSNLQDVCKEFADPNHTLSNVLRVILMNFIIYLRFFGLTLDFSSSKTYAFWKKKY